MIKRLLLFVSILALINIIPVLYTEQPAYSASYPCASSMVPNDQIAQEVLQSSYQKWKSMYVTSSGAGGHLRVVRPQNNNDTVSEGIAYGMLLSAYMNDQSTFDGLWRYAKSHLDPNGLMHWRIDANNNTIGFNAATDADEDMAIALIVAAKRWSGYQNEAKQLINKIMQYEVEPGTYVLKPGDVWGGSSVTNPSYFTPAYYKVFKAYTGDQRWDQVVNKQYEIIRNLNNKTGAKVTGLLPDWTTASGDPASGMGFDYTYDATRVPWRLAMDAAWYCDANATSQLTKLNAFFKGIGAANIKDGYRLDGTLIGSWHNASFVAPAASGAIISPDSAYKQAMWNETVQFPFVDYYADSLKVLSILLMSGYMANPLEM